MKIISEFKDYYDCIQHTIFDKTTIYFRHKKIIQKPHAPRRWYTDSIEVYYGIIYFCGKKYPFIEVAQRYAQSDFFYCPDKADTYIREILTGNELKRYLGEARHKYYGSETVNSLYNGWERFLIKCQNEANIDIFHAKHQSPIIVKHDNWLIANPCLKEYAFYRAVDEYTAFQEIYMYLSGVLGGNFQPIPEVSDLDMIEAKGFDKRYSFRKDKET